MTTTEPLANTNPAPRARRLPWTAAATLAASLWLQGCAPVAFREAMSRVQVRYLALRDTLERGSNFASRDAAAELERELTAPEIAVTSPYQGDEEYRRLLEAALASTRDVRRVARDFDRESLAATRSGVKAACDSCHARFRHAD